MVVRNYDCWSYNAQWCLIEMLLDIPASEIKWDEFVAPEKKTTPGNWQCPYMEQYLNEEGTERICEVYEIPQRGHDHCRVAFFLYKTSGMMLRTPYGEFALRGDREAPERLRSILVFEE